MLSRLFRQTDRSYFQTTHKMTDDQYFALVVKSLEKSTINDLQMPGFPEDSIQKQFVGSTQRDALQEGFNFYKVVKQYCQSLGNPIRPNTKIVDFGCGWGRITRFFFKDIHPENIFGLDVDFDMISFCSTSLHCGTYQTVNPEPPTEFKDNSVDIIFAYSVFSHLAKTFAINWIKEFSRILKPNGVLLATTQARFFFDYVESLKDQELGFSWHKTIVNAFDPIEVTKKKYDGGQFIYVPTGGGGIRSGNFYGEALIPKEFVEKEFGKFLKFRYFISDINKLPQALFVMQKEV